MITNSTPSPSLDPRADAVLCSTTARLLAASVDSAGLLGLLCAWLAAAVLIMHLPAASAACAVLVLVPVERWLALRLHFDAGLFADLAVCHAAPTGSAAALSLQALDQALLTLRLRAPSATTRALPDRVRGARRLLRWHGLVVAAQFAGLSLALVLGLQGAASCNGLRP